MKNIPPHFNKRIEPEGGRDNLDRIKEIFPGIPQEQIERARQYKTARKGFMKTLSRVLSENDRQYQIGLFSRIYWKIDEG